MSSDRLVRYIVTVDSAGALAGMQRVSGATEQAANRMQAAGGRMKSVGAGMVSMGRSLSQVALPIAAVGGYAIKSSIDFEKSMTLIQTQAGASAKEVAWLSKKVLGLGHTGFDGNELSKALYFIRSDGFEAGKAIDVLKASAAGAAISGADLSATAYGLTSVLRTGLPDVHNASDAMSTLNSIVGLGKLTWEQLNAGLGAAGFLASVKKSGIGLKDVGTAIDALARRGTLPDAASTNLRKALIQMVAVTGISRKALGKIGITQFELAKDLKHPHGLIYALQDLQNHLNKVSPEKGTSLLAQAFGRSKGAGTIFQLLETLPEQRKIEKEREKWGTLQSRLAATEKTNAFKIKEAMALLKNGLIELGSSLAPVVIPFFLKLVNVLKDAAKWFKDASPFVKELGTYLGIAAILGGPLLILFGNLTKVLGSLFFILPGLSKLFPALGAATGAGAEAASGGIAALLPEIAALLAAAAAVYAMYKLIKAIKDFLSSSGGGAAKTRGAKALKAFHQPSSFTADTHGALAMLGGGGTVHAGALGLGSAAEANELRQHAGALGNTEAGGKAAGHRTGAEIEKAIAERNAFIVHSHLHLDGKQIAEVTSTFLRDNPSSKAAKHHTEAVLRKSFINNARSANP